MWRLWAPDASALKMRDNQSSVRDCGTVMFFAGQSRRMWDGWQVCTFMGNFGTLGPYVYGRTLNSGPIYSWGTLEPWAHTFMGELWNPGPIHSWGNFGILGPYIHGGTLQHTLMGKLWNPGPIYCLREHYTTLFIDC